MDIKMKEYDSLKCIKCKKSEKCLKCNSKMAIEKKETIVNDII